MKLFAEVATVHEVGRTIALKTIALRLQHKIKLPDALIAATALHHDLILITRNIVDFEEISGLSVVNPHLY